MAEQFKIRNRFTNWKIMKMNGSPYCNLNSLQPLSLYRHDTFRDKILQLFTVGFHISLRSSNKYIFLILNILVSLSFLSSLLESFVLQFNMNSHIGIIISVFVDILNLRLVFFFSRISNVPCPLNLM